MNSFADLQILTTLIKTLKEKKIYHPTEIQSKVLPLILNGSSLVGISETGSGKTLSYALPILHHLKTAELNGDDIQKVASPRAVILVPTRELGEQVSKVFKLFTHLTRLRVRPALGGMTFEQSRLNIAGSFEILLATPGRLIKLMDSKLINLKDVRYLVFDEADQMLDQGFLSDSQKIRNACPEETLLLLFSATLTKSVESLMNKLFSDAVVIKSSGAGKTVKTLETKNLSIEDGKRWPVLEKLLKKNQKQGTLIFTNTREQCDKLASELKSGGFEYALYRGDMDKKERRSNYKRFMKGEIDIMISTDLASRGLDLDRVERVINYNLPKQMENYLHRVGRTARAGKAGTVFNFVTERDLNLLREVEKIKFQKRN